MKERPWAWPSIVAAFLVACVAPAHAQTASLRQGFEAAWARQPEGKAASLRRDAAAAALSAAQRWSPEPAALELTAKTDRFTRNDGSREYDAALAIPLWLPGERDRAQASALAEAQAVDARLLAAKWRLAAELREAYWAWQRASLDEELAAHRLANAQRLAEDVARRVRAGDLARSDSHQAEGASAAAQAAHAEAVAARVKATSAWRALTGLPEVPQAFSAEPAPIASEIDRTHPALRELAAKVEVASRQQSLIAIQNRPNTELTLGAVRERGAAGERYGQSLVVGIRIPLGKSSASAGKLASASAERLEVESQLSLETERLRAQAEAARASVAALQAAHAAAERRAALARESRGFFEKSFRLGESDLPTRQRVELEAYEAERQAARGRLEAEAAISQLRQVLGLLPE